MWAEAERTGGEEEKGPLQGWVRKQIKARRRREGNGEEGRMA